jgi:DNA polymerase-3 subunit beta
MKTVSIEIPRADLRAMLHCAAKDDVRYYMNGVTVEIGRNESRLVATDGHMLGVLRLEVKSDLTETREFIIPRAEIEAIKKAKRNEPELLAFTADLEASDGGYWAQFNDDATTRRFKLIDGKFPDWRRVVPAKPDGAIAQFDAALLIRFQKVRAELNDSKNTFSPYLTHNGDGPALVSIGNERFCGVVMPMRGEPMQTAPAWVSQPLTPAAKVKAAA